jgi:hypothetical protein
MLDVSTVQTSRESAMRPRDRVDAERIDAALAEFHKNVRRLPGIQDPAHRMAFLEQLLESIHRVRYIDQGVVYRHGVYRDIHQDRANPASGIFDPIKAAALRARQADHDEACWFVFLFVHFGKNLRTGYRLAQDVYGSLGNGPNWDWTRISANPEAFRRWLAANRRTLENGDAPGHFGNHRKYLSLDPNSPGGTGEAFVSYVRWVASHRTHNGLFEDAASKCGHDGRRTFHYLYHSMNAVASFGRLAKLDYLTMIGKLDLACIEPGSTYMTNSTGPLAGARLLFGQAASSAKPSAIDAWLVELEAVLGLGMGMQIIEEALCNWQKSPAQFIPFRG